MSEQDEAPKQQQLKKLEEPTKKMKEPLPKALLKTNDEDFTPEGSASDEDIIDDGINSSSHSSIDIQAYLKYCEEQKNTGNEDDVDGGKDKEENLDGEEENKENENNKKKEEEKIKGNQEKEQEKKQKEEK